MEKILLYYKFVPVEDTESVLFWQRALCEKLGLKGRILISHHGINGTIGGDLKHLKYYTRDMKKHSLFGDINWKWMDGGADNFPKLVVKVKEEIVVFDATDEIKVTNHGIEGGGQRLSPTALRQLVDERGDEVVFYDGRNVFEAQIGHFRNAVLPDVQNSRDFKADIDRGEISKYKDRPIVTYCTGGIRCEILSVLMKNRGYKDVYQLDGGVVKFGQQFPGDDLWEGKLFVFDGRMQMEFSDGAEDLTTCYNCGAPTSRQVNSLGVRRKLIVCCENCPTPPD